MKARKPARSVSLIRLSKDDPAPICNASCDTATDFSRAALPSRRRRTGTGGRRRVTRSPHRKMQNRARPPSLPPFLRSFLPPHLTKCASIFLSSDTFFAVSSEGRNEGRREGAHERNVLKFDAAAAEDIGRGEGREACSPPRRAGPALFILCSASVPRKTFWASFGAASRRKITSSPSGFAHLECPTCCEERRGDTGALRARLGRLPLPPSLPCLRPSPAFFLSRTIVPFVMHSSFSRKESNFVCGVRS